MNKKAVVLLSGGLDSSVTAYIAHDLGYSLAALSISYGQAHVRELKAASSIAQHLHVLDHKILSLDLSIFGGSALLTSTSTQIPTNTSIDTIGKKIPPTYVPARNTIFLSLALAYAETIQADAIFIGVTSADYSGYPDCRPAFIEAFQNLTNIATKKTIEHNPITIETPLISDSKKNIIQKGQALQVPFQDTWSCYQGKENACGVCETCLLRLKGFQEAGFPDPLSYETYPEWYTVH